MAGGVFHQSDPVHGHFGDDAAALQLGQRAHEDEDHHCATKR